MPYCCIYAHTNGSLLLATLMHAAVNNSKDIVPSAVAGATNTFGLSTSVSAWLTVALLRVCHAYFVVRMPKAKLAGGGERPSQNEWAARLRGFGPLGTLVSVAIPFAGTAFISAILVLLWARLSRTAWREIGYARPKSWIGAVAVGIAFGVSFKFLMKAILMPLLSVDPINQAYHFLAGNRAALLRMVVVIILGAGFGEETVYRGFLFERLCKLFGSGVSAKVSTVLLTAAWFGVVHYHDQGLAGAEQAAITGLVIGTIYSITGRLFMLMIAHVAFDLTAVAIIYWNLESKVAHLVFK